MNKIFLGLAFLGLVSVSLADEPADSEFECSDFPACVLQVEAWDALAAGQFERAADFAAACAKLDEEVGRKQQASLSAKPSDDEWLKYGPLNGAGTCYFIKGEALSKLGKKDKAMAAYKTVIEEFPYAKAWDPRGWFWTVADAAKEAMAKL